MAFSAFFDSAECVQGSPVLQHVSVLHFLLPSNTIPVYGYITFYLSIHHLMMGANNVEHHLSNNSVLLLNSHFPHIFLTVHNLPFT